MSNKSDKTQTHRKVLFLSRLLSPHVGGVERHIDELSEELKKRGYGITVITQQHDASLALKEKTNLYTVYRIPKAVHAKVRIWLWILAHAHLFLTADIIHAHDVFWWALPLRFLFFWKPFFTTFHGYEGSGEPTQKAIRSRRVAQRLSRANICVGAWMEKWYGTKPDKVIYGAANFIEQPPVKTLTAVFVGRLAQDTGVLEYIEGIKLLHGKVELDIYGEGELLPQIQKAIADTPFIQYKGVSHDVVGLLKSHRFAFVSRYLGMIEAMQTGRYVFAQWNNAIKRDYLESFPGAHSASLFSLPEELAQEINYLISHFSEEKVKVADALDWAKKQKWERVADIYEDVWKK